MSHLVLYGNICICCVSPIIYSSSSFLFLISMSDLPQLKSHHVFDFVIVCGWLCDCMCCVWGFNYHTRHGSQSNLDGWLMLG